MFQSCENWIKPPPHSPDRIAQWKVGWAGKLTPFARSLSLSLVHQVFPASNKSNTAIMYHAVCSESQPWVTLIMYTPLCGACTSWIGKRQACCTASFFFLLLLFSGNSPTNKHSVQSEGKRNVKNEKQWKSARIFQAIACWFHYWFCALHSCWGLFGFCGCGERSPQLVAAAVGSQHTALRCSSSRSEEWLWRRTELLVLWSAFFVQLLSWFNFLASAL